MVVVVERHHRSSDGDTTLFLNLHPVGSSSLLDLVRLDRTRHMNSTSEQQEFLGKRCFTRIRVTDDCERSSSLDLF